MAISAGSICSVSARLSCGVLPTDRWVCMSIRPGSSVTSPRSMDCAPSGTLSVMAEMRSPSTTTTAFGLIVPLRTSSTRAAWMATGAATEGTVARMARTAARGFIDPEYYVGIPMEFNAPHHGAIDESILVAGLRAGEPHAFELLVRQQ